MTRVLDLTGPSHSWDDGMMDRLFVNTVPSCLPEIWSPGGTGIHRAILAGRLHQVRLLISMNANVDKRDSAGYTPLMISAMVSPEEHGVRCMKVLLKAGASINMVDFVGRSALGLACLHGRAKIVDILLQEDKLEKNKTDKNGDTPLNLAASQGFTDVVSLLVSSLFKDAISADKRNHQGCTALLLATKMGHYDCARILLEKGKASVSSRDNDHFMNPTEWAEFNLQKLTSEITSRSSLLVDDPRLRASQLRPGSVPTPATSSSSRTAKRFIPPFHSFAKEIQMIGQLRQEQVQLAQLLALFHERDRDRSESGSRGGSRRKDSRRSSISSAISTSTERLDPDYNSNRSSTSTSLDLSRLFKIYTEQQKTRPSQAAKQRLLVGSIPAMIEPPAPERHGSALARPPPVRRQATSMLSTNSSTPSQVKRRISTVN